MLNKFLCGIAIIVISGFGKFHAQQAIAATGFDATGSGGSSSYSVGQIDYSAKGANNEITEGLQQPYEIVTLGNNDFAEINLVMSAYPNPTIDVLNLVVSDEKWSGMSYQLFDLNGKTLSKLQKMITSETSVSMQELQSGIYFLTITNGSKKIKTFKIIKK